MARDFDAEMFDGINKIPHTSAAMKARQAITIIIVLIAVFLLKAFLAL